MKSPIDNRWYYFVDKCLTFGSSISCAHFQAFSDAVAHIVAYLTKKETVNYLDDFLFAALIKLICDQQVETFFEGMRGHQFSSITGKDMLVEHDYGVSGLLIDTIRQLVCIPKEKILRAQELINESLSKRKITLHRLQRLCEYLNFLCCAIVPGRAFTSCLYSYTSGNLKPHHHIKITTEIKEDLSLWLKFLDHPTAYCHSFMDFRSYSVDEIDFYTDASKNFELGMGGVCQQSWMWMIWGDDVAGLDPSIEYLELFALAAGVLAWISKFQNMRVCIFCDNMSVVHMVNNMSSKCKNCMVLIRLITLECMKQNVRLYAKHVRTHLNSAADALSRLEFAKFKRVPAH